MDDDDDVDDNVLIAELIEGVTELGFRLEEDLESGQSIVTLVSPDLWASECRIEPGMICMRINGSASLSHAHTIATIKHGKRPLRIELKKKKRDL